ncbi:tRNA(His) guanylyltransferase Thg1 family protein [Nocardia sp. NPDC004860]|uniref:tRNA(His) guanylyltransferase Thg1 family protein n=1 Tax=Nocardia sp. NPDC004860 TaxID=3154557 RepID=UPI0033A7D3E9
MTSIGDRMKAYEAPYNQKLTPNSCVIIRVDGRAFHTFTRRMRKPFDHALMNVMVKAAVETAREMQGFKLGYVQSDEATFLITDFDTHDTTGWFGYELNKLVSLSASLFTGFFNLAMHNDPGPAAFDSRAFVVPREDVPNMFVWRQQDWERNSLQMLARAHFSHKECHGKNRQQLHDMLMLEKGINWADLSGQEKNGSIILKNKTIRHDKFTYETVDLYLDAVIRGGETEIATLAS